MKMYFSGFSYGVLNASRENNGEENEETNKQKNKNRNTWGIEHTTSETG